MSQKTDSGWNAGWGGIVWRQPDGSLFYVPWLTDLARSGNPSGLEFIVPSLKPEAGE
jgi:hypothetical protein